MTHAPSAIIADDEDLPRAELRRMLAAAWPELRIAAECEHGAAAIDAIDEHQPDIAFLDIRMPGQSGLDVARAASGRCHVVFTTAYDSHAVEAFDAGALDYLLKPVLAERLAHCVARLRERLSRPGPPLRPSAPARPASPPRLPPEPPPKAPPSSMPSSYSDRARSSGQSDTGAQLGPAVAARRRRDPLRRLLACLRKQW